METITPNALAKRLNRLAKMPCPDTDGLPENQCEYVRCVRNVLERYRKGRIGEVQAQAERRSYQIRYLQKPIIQEIIESWNLAAIVKDTEAEAVTVPAMELEITDRRLNR